MTESSAPYKFHSTFKVRWAEVDLQKVVFYGNYLIYADEALMEYLQRFNFGFKDLWARGLDWVYADAHLSFKGSAQFEDVLNVYVRIGRIGNSSITAEMQVFNQQQKNLIVTLELTIVVVDLNTRTPVRVPDEFRQAVEAYQAG